MHSQWIKSLDGAFLSPADVLYVSVHRDDHNVRVGLVCGDDHYVAPEEMHKHTIKLMDEVLHDNGVYCHLGEDDDDDILIPVQFNLQNVHAVYMQCGEPDSDGDYSYVFVSSSGDERVVFSAATPSAMRNYLGPAFNVVAPVVDYRKSIVDAGKPCYIVAFRMNKVSYYGDVMCVDANRAMVCATLSNGYYLGHLWVDSRMWQLPASSCEPPAKRQCL